MTISPSTLATSDTVRSSSEPLHLNTPLIYSSHLSQRTGHKVYLKLDSDQPSGSFKIRGIGAICQEAIDRCGVEATYLVSSSGGNAGLAVAYAALRAGVGCTIYVPVSTEVDVVERLRGMQARVVVGGEAWDAADAAAREEVGKVEGAVYVHPFEGDLLAQGHSSLIDELYDSMDSIDVLISSVGGGGLLRGIIQGSSRQPKTHQPVLVAVQNFGVDSFNRSFNKYLSHQHADVVQLDAIQSKCTSMGTKRCSQTTLLDAIDYHNKLNEMVTLTVTDALSASACWQFSQLPLDGKKRLVELSCASCLTPLFHPWILERVLAASQKLKGKSGLNIVVEVCGGSKVDEKLVEEYKIESGMLEAGDRINVNGVEYPKQS